MYLSEVSSYIQKFCLEPRPTKIYDRYYTKVVFICRQLFIHNKRETVLFVTSTKKKKHNKIAHLLKGILPQGCTISTTILFKQLKLLFTELHAMSVFSFPNIMVLVSAIISFVSQWVLQQLWACVNTLHVWLLQRYWIMQHY